jgi:SET domain-containing protein
VSLGSPKDSTASGKIPTEISKSPRVFLYLYMKLIKHKGLYIDKSEVHGWGVFSTEKISAGAIVEECPVPEALFPLEYQHKYLHLLPFPSLKDKIAMWQPTGFSPHLNHSTDYNVTWSVDTDKMLATFVAHKDIEPNQELFIDYSLEM